MPTILLILALQTQVTGSVVGVVRDTAGRPISYALVFVGPPRHAMTDSLGQYRIDSVPAGRLAVSIRRLGFDMRVDTVVIQPGAETRATFVLHPAPGIGQVKENDYAIPAKSSPSYEGFSMGLFREVTRVARDSNVFLSPASAAIALAMTYGGSGGKTETAMAHALGVEGETPEKLGPENAKLLQSLADQKDVQLTIANSIWAGAGKPFLRSFLESTRNDYHAEVRSMVLQGPAAQHEINDWVAKATHDKIQALLADTLPDTTVMVLLNAVYFKGLWKDKFDTAATQAHPFTLAGGRVVSRKLMYRHGDIQYQRGANFAAVRLPHKGDRIAMYVFLPDSGVPLADVAPTWMGKFDSVRMRLGLPKFHIEYQTTLNDPLKALGMDVAFDSRRADFSRMIRDAGVFISTVVQKTYVDVDEQGTEAAAATGVTVQTSSYHPEPEMIVDRPFITAIRDDRTGLILFLGQINDPTQR
ncbi:MAG TPA: serpin family protein [Gemmatimonadaceae bacterium]|nr:serpin family protein [Gemmatimonadaceae bacterium]